MIRTPRLVLAAVALLGHQAACQSNAEVHPQTADAVEIPRAADEAAPEQPSEPPHSKPAHKKKGAAKSTPRVEVGAVSVDGGAVANAPVVAASLVGQFQDCQSRWDREAVGHLTVSAKVGPNGEVRFAMPTVANDVSTKLVACVTSQVAGAQFSPPEGENPTVFIPVSFVR